MVIKEKNKNAAPDMILSDVHENLGETYVPYNAFGSPYIINEKEFTSASADNETNHINPEKIIVSDTIWSNDIYMTKQKYQCVGNMPGEQSHSQENCQFRLILMKDEQHIIVSLKIFNKNSENTVHSMVKIRMNLKIKVKMMISERSKIACMVITMLCNEIAIMSKHNY